MFDRIFRNSVYRNDINQFIYYIFGYGAALVLSYGLNVLLNKSLPPDELGLFSYVQGLINILAPIFCLAFYNAYLRFHKDHTLSRSMLRMGLPFYLFSAAACAVVIAIVTKSVIPLLYAAFVFFTERQYILRVQMQIWKLNLLRVMELLVPCLFLGVLYLLKVEATASWVLLFYGVGFCTAFLFSPKSKLNEEEVSKKDLFQYLFPVMGTTFITFVLLNAGVLFAKNYFGLSGAAEWGVAFRAVTIYRSFTSLFLIFFPMIYFREAAKNNYRIINIYRTGIILFAVLLLLPFVLFPGLVYRVLGAARYEASSLLLVFLACGELCNFVSGLFGLFFNYEIKTWKNTLFKGAELILFLLGAFLLARKSLMVMGGVYLFATVLPLIVMMFLSLSQETRYFKHSHNEKGQPS